MMFEIDNALEQAILRVLLGNPVSGVAPQYTGDYSHLLAAAEAYQAAGRQALNSLSSSRWHYWRISLAMTADLHPERRRPATGQDHLLSSDLGPLCTQLAATGEIVRWWFLRKEDGGPHIRLRVFGLEPGLSQAILPRIEEKLTSLKQLGYIQRWITLSYEPEMATFGGPAGMEVAHDLFHRDSESVYHWLTAERCRAEKMATSLYRHRRPEVSLLILQQFLKGAALDMFERWDVWMQVKKMRPWQTTAKVEQRQANMHALAGLLLSSKAQQEALFGEPFHSLFLHWKASFELAGKELAQLSREGALQRGLRSVLASHIIFHWNRFGLDITLQTELAHLVEKALSERL